MSTQRRRRRGTTLQHASFTGAQAEITVDTDKRVAIVHDGATAGGHPLARADLVYSDIDRAYLDRASLEAATVPATVGALRCAGYRYRRAVSEPAHGGKIQSADATWWELAEPVIDPLMLGAIGDGTTDDAAAVEAAILMGRPLFWGGPDRVYRLTSVLDLTIGFNIDWRSEGASIFYDPAAPTQNAVRLVLNGGDHTIVGRLKLDANKLAYRGFMVSNNTDNIANLTIEDMSVYRVYRAGTAFAGGDGIFIEGNFDAVNLVRPTVVDVALAVGAGTPGSQGVRGIIVKASATTPFRAPRLVNVVDAMIEKIYPEDPSYEYDQDGLVIFGAEDVGEQTAPYETKAYVRGGRFKNCYGRGMKMQVDYANVSGSHFVRTEGRASGIGGAEIDFQVGGGSVSDITACYYSYVPSYVVLFNTTDTETKSVPFGQARGIQVHVEGDKAIDAVVSAGHRDVPNNIMASDICVTGKHNYVGWLAAASGGGPAIVGNRLFLRDVITSGPIAALVRTQTAGLVGYVGLRGCVNLGAAVPIISQSTSNQTIEKSVNGVMIGFTGDLTGSELTIASGAITLGDMEFYTIDTEADAVSDDLDTINGGKFIGETRTFRAANSNRTVVLKDGTGNLQLNGDFSLTHAYDVIVLKLVTASVWVEVSRSDNSA